MPSMKNTFKIIGLITLFLVLFRGSMYRQIIRYSQVGTRPEVKITDIELIERIKNRTQQKKIDLHEIAEIANHITKEELKFTTKKTESDPNKLMHSKIANCIGYSYMFNSIANFIIDENQIRNEFKAEHKIGKLELLGIDIHKYFEDAFFKDHDFNQITNLKTGKSIFVDPSLSDYLYIDRINVKTE